MIKCNNCKANFESYKDFNNHLFLKCNKVCKESYKTESCECCNKKFKKFGVSFHVLQYSKECYEFYLKKYKELDNFPWKKLSDQKNKNKLIIKCECCGLRCRNRNGISKHIFQHSKECYEFYIQKYGSDRLYWPKETGLNFAACADCGKKLGEIPCNSRNTIYCKKCRQHNHNVMKIQEVQKKVGKTLKKIYQEKPEYKLNLSTKAKERFKNNPKYAEDQRQYMLSGGAAKASSANKSPSKPQVKLFELVKEIYQTSILNYPILELNYVLDIAIPDLKIWIESDGYYWHQDKEKDLERQRKIEKLLEWKCIRYKIDNVKNVPNIDQIKQDIEKIIGD